MVQFDLKNFSGKILSSLILEQILSGLILVSWVYYAESLTYVHLLHVSGIKHARHIEWQNDVV